MDDKLIQQLVEMASELTAELRAIRLELRAHTMALMNPDENRIFSVEDVREQWDHADIASSSE